MIEKIKVGERVVAVRELTVKDQRDWLKERKAAGEKAASDGADYDLVAWQLFADVRLDDIAFMSDLSLAEMEDLTPTQIDDVVQVCKKVNPHFFDMRKRAGL